MAIEQRRNGTVGRNFNPRKSADQTLTNLSSAPGGALVLQVQDVGSLLGITDPCQLSENGQQSPRLDGFAWKQFGVDNVPSYF